jgi:hypothetical protein
LFESKFSPGKAASASLVEIIRVGASNSENVEETLQLWEKATRHLNLNGDGTTFTYGKSLNLEEDVIMAVIGWQNLEVR